MMSFPIKKINSFYDLITILEYCDSLMIEHQVLLMKQNYDQAFACFEKMYSIRLKHLEQMENTWLPEYENATPVFPSGGRPLYFLREKKLIVRDLEKHVRKAGQLALEHPGGNFNIVELFESYIRTKDLLDHHDAREKAFLFPLLQELPDNSRNKLIDEINKNIKLYHD